ncbi:NAD-binding protein [Amylocystis lapponica]|nr:NAD-binding protein [Amylocystis lapponica]
MASASPKAPARVAIVTGSIQGLGLAIALRLADDGLDIAVNDLKSKGAEMQAVVSQIENKGRRAIAVGADISSEKEVQDLIATVVEKLGGVDVIVANAGIVFQKTMLETSTEEWDRMMAVNVRGVMLCYKYAALQMIKQGRGGRIIGASSIAGKRGLKTLSAYSAAKFAVRGLTQSAAQELAKHKITVNGYAPGFIITPMSTGLMTEDKHAGADFKKQVGVDPDCPDATPDVISSAVSYLASPEAYFVNGQTLVIDGAGTYLD